MTAKKKFTNKEIDRLVHNTYLKASETEFPDARADGLRIVVSKTGRKYFILRYTFGGRKRSMKLGDFGAMTIEEAAEAAWAARKQLSAGIDPQESRSAIKLIPTFATFVGTEYLPWAQQAKRSWEDDVSRLNLRILPIFGPRLISDIGTRDINAFIRSLAALPVMPATCNRYLHLLSAIFRLAVEYGVVSENPCSKIKPLQENNMRQRFLSKEEVGRLMNALYREKNRVAASYIQFLLLTGARREEGLGAKWEDVDLVRSEWRIPETKSGKSRIVPLNGAAVAVLQKTPIVSGNPYIFTGKLEYQHLVNPVKAFKRVLTAAKIFNLRLHDLRHTFASYAVINGVSLYKVQHLLGHSNPKTTERYAHLSNDALMEASGQVAEALHMATAEGGGMALAEPLAGVIAAGAEAPLLASENGHAMAVTRA